MKASALDTPSVPPSAFTPLAALGRGGGSDSPTPSLADIFAKGIPTLKKTPGQVGRGFKTIRTTGAGGDESPTPSLGGIFAGGMPTLKKTPSVAERGRRGSIDSGGGGGLGIGGISLVGVKLKKTKGPRVGGKLQKDGT
jgi:hypothetical protein